MSILVIGTVHWVLASDVRLGSLYQKNETSHIEMLYWSLISFAKST